MFRKLFSRPSVGTRKIYLPAEAAATRFCDASIRLVEDSGLSPEMETAIFVKWQVSAFMFFANVVAKDCDYAISREEAGRWIYHFVRRYNRFSQDEQEAVLENALALLGERRKQLIGKICQVSAQVWRETSEEVEVVELADLLRAYSD